MPQKKNPDIPELVRGKTARVYGDLIALLTLMKAQPFAYNRDNQEDKESLFDAVDTVRMCLTAYAGLVPTITVRHDAMRQAAEEGFATATDLADYLVVQGLPFRDAHAVVGKVVQYAIEKNKSLPLLSLPEFQQFSELIKDDVFAVLKLEGSVSARNHVGGTSPEQVKAQVSRLKKLI
jgi:argininosuccinate lyase